MKSSYVIGGLVVAAVVGGIWWHHKQQGAGALGQGGGGAPKQLGQGGNAYDPAKWHVAAVTSDYGKSLGLMAPVGDFNPGDYVTFVLAYGAANDPRIDPVILAMGKIGALGQPTSSGKKVANVQFKKMLKPNSNWSQAVPPPALDTDFSVSTDEVAGILTPDEAQGYFGTA